LANNEPKFPTRAAIPKGKQLSFGTIELN